MSVPVIWDELGRLRSAANFTLGSVGERLEAPSPYIATLGEPQRLTDAVVEWLSDWVAS